MMVIDASAAVEFLLKTPVGVQVDAFVGWSALLAPELLDAEVLSVLRREVLSRRLAEARAEEALEDLGDWGIQRLPHRSLLATAWGLRRNLSAYDALYVAAAVDRGIPLLTADGPLSRAPLRGVIVHNIRGP